MSNQGSDSTFKGFFNHLTASEIKFDLRFVINNIDYPGIHLHITSNSPFGGLWGYGGLQVASVVKSDLRYELCDLKFITCNVYLILFLKKLLIPRRRRRRLLRTSRPVCKAAGNFPSHSSDCGGFRLPICALAWFSEDRGPFAHTDVNSHAAAPLGSIAFLSRDFYKWVSKKSCLFYSPSFACINFKFKALYVKFVLESFLVRLRKITGWPITLFSRLCWNQN